jgi:hypothetical protein
MAAWRFGRVIRLLKFTAAFPADTALVRPPSMNNRVVDCISDEYDTAAWIDPSEQLFARRGLTPASAWACPAWEEEGLTVTRDVRTQESMNRCHSVHVIAPQSTRNEQFLRSHFEFSLGLHR